MERTKYFNYTKPSQTQLNYTEDSRARSILKRQRSSAQMGIRTGFRVSINVADATKIDIGPGEGYTGGFFEQKNLRAVNAGEVISTLTDEVTGSGYIPTKVGQALANYANGTRNYVSLVYAETESQKLAENRTPFVEHDTIVAETYTVEVLTEANWLLLSNDELEDRVLVGIVTAKGIGVALTLSDVEQLTQPTNHQIASTPTLVTGVTISRVSVDTLIGDGVLRWDPSVSTLFWEAPGDFEGTGTVLSTNGAATLYSSNTSYYLEVNITFSLLPVVATSETLTISSLYGRTIPLYSSIDQAHRDMLGTGSLSVTNPHALSIEDITGGSLEHAQYFHRNGLSYVASPTELECNIGAGAFDDYILVTNLGGEDDKFLINGVTYNLINGVAAATDGSVDFNAVTQEGVYIIYLDGGANLQSSYISDAVFSAVGNFGTCIKLVDLRGTSAGQCTLDWVQADRTLTFTGRDGVAGTAVLWQNSTTGTYYKLYSANTDNWIIIYIDGDLSVVANDTLTFNTDFNDLECSQENMLKLCSVEWTGTGGSAILSNLFDLRRFNTADNRDVVEAEHGTDGSHTKVLQQQFRVVDSSNAIYGSAATVGISGVGGNSAVAVAGTGVRGVGYASNANWAIGLYADAGNYLDAESAIAIRGGVAGAGATGIYVYHNASGFAIYGYAPNAGGTGVYGNAFETGGAFKGVTVGAYGSAVTGICGLAPAVGATAVYGSAPNGKGAYLIGSATGAYCTATEYGIRAFATIGVSAGGQTAFMGEGYIPAGAAPAWAYGIRALAYNIDNEASAIGVSGGAAWANATAIYASGATGIYCSGTFAVNTALSASAQPANSWFYANVNNTGVYILCYKP